MRLLTLAPEVDVRGDLTKKCVDSGVRVAAGHTDAQIHEFERCIAIGLDLFTHLGNACPPMLDRHDNVILRALSLSDHISYSLIADSFHVPELLFRNLLRWIPIEKLFVVSDAICAAGLGPGVYQLGNRTVKIGEDRAARDPSGEHFVGSACRMVEAADWLASLGLPDELKGDLLCKNALRYLGSTELDPAS